MGEECLSGATLRLCGGFALRSELLTATTFRTHRLVALLAYLALHPEGKATREELADRLWPNLEGSAGRNNLRLTLHYLRETLSKHRLEHALITQGNWVGLDRTVIGSDVARFQQLVQDARRSGEDRVRLLTLAAETVRGGLLNELYDEWFDPYRARLEEERYSVLCDLADALLPTDPERALAYAKEACSIDPLAPQGHERVADALLALGDRTASSKELRGYEALLERELGTKLPPRLHRLLSQSESDALYRSARRSIPVPSTPLLGRDREIKKIESWLAGPSRLMTLYGPGGIGKTRLANEIARNSGSNRPTAWVDLARVETGAALTESLIRAGGAMGPSPLEPVAQLASIFGSENTLFVLDNVEQISDHELEVIPILLSSLPQAKFLLTSRKTLGFPGETLLKVQPLDVPGPLAPECSASYQLFLERAGACRPDADPSEWDPGLVSQIATRLEGIPLAIELAAARLMAMDLPDLVAELVAPLNLLVSPRRSHERHGAMRATLKWSFDKLDLDTAQAVCRMAGLHGTFDRAAANAVCADLTTGQPIDQTLQIACEHSLIDLAPGLQTRYRMLECTRQYAWETLQPSVQETVRRAAADHFMLVAQRGGGNMGLLEEMPNLEAALGYFAGRPELSEKLLEISRALMWLLLETTGARTALYLIQEAAERLPQGRLRGGLLLQVSYLQLALTMYARARETAGEGAEMAEAVGDAALRSELLSVKARALFVTGPESEAREVALAAVKDAGEDPRLRARALQALSRVLNLYKDPKALTAIEEAVRQARLAADPFLLIEVLDSAGAAQSDHHRLDDARASWMEIEGMQTSFLPNGRKRCLLLQRLGALEEMEGHSDESQRYFEEALEVAYGCKYEWGITQSLTQLGHVLHNRGDYEASVSCHLSCLDRRRGTEDARGIATSLLGAGTSLLALGRFEEGQALLLQAVPTVYQLGTDFCLYRCIVPCAEAAFWMGDRIAAQAIAASAVRLFDRLHGQGVDLDSQRVTPTDICRARELAAIQTEKPPAEPGAIG